MGHALWRPPPFSFGAFSRSTGYNQIRDYFFWLSQTQVKPVVRTGLENGLETGVRQQRNPAAGSVLAGFDGTALFPR